MKANEAPEKIYLYPSDRAGEEYENEWGDIPWGEDYVEYTRTDALIEKAVKFMEKIDDVDEYSWYNEEEHAAGITEKCIEDFKKYMKDE